MFGTRNSEPVMSVSYSESKPRTLDLRFKLVLETYIFSDETLTRTRFSPVTDIWDYSSKVLYQTYNTYLASE